MVEESKNTQYSWEVTHALMTRNVNNALLKRSDFIPDLDIGKNINGECGYPDEIRIEDYYEMYRREGIGTRIIKVMPEETWHVVPKIINDEALDELTPFEQAWIDIEKSKMLFSMMKRCSDLTMGAVSTNLSPESRTKKMSLLVRIKNTNCFTYVRWRRLSWM